MINFKEFLALRVFQACALGIVVGIGLGWLIFDGNRTQGYPYSLGASGHLKLNRKTGEAWILNAGKREWEKIDAGSSK